MHLLIDADSLIYKATAPCDTKMYVVFNGEEEIEFFQYKKDLFEFLAIGGNDELLWEHLVVESEPVENALHNLKVKIQLILDEVQPDSYELFLTRGDNFRYGIATTQTYKGTRAGKPSHFEAGFHYLVKYWGATYTEGLEADDVVAMKQSDNTCIAHIDKDIDTVAGSHFNFDTYEFYELTEQEALCNFYRQFLVGDTSDNILGVVGIGKKGAAKIITPDMTEYEMFEQVQIRFKNDVRLLETGRLLHMTRALHKDGTPVLWEFPSSEE